MTWWKLRRWRREGVLPPPRQARTPGARGSSSVYPIGTFEQALVVADMLRRHRSFPKVALLLFARGFPVERRAFQAVLVAGLDWVDAEISRYAGEAREEDLPLTTANAIVAESVRTARERSFRKALLSAASSEGRLQRALAELVGLYIGRSMESGDLLAAHAAMGQNVRASAGEDESQFALVMIRIDERLREAQATGGLRTLLRSAVLDPDFEASASLRDHAREFIAFSRRIGVPLVLPSAFLQELVEALGASVPKLAHSGVEP